MPNYKKSAPDNANLHYQPHIAHYQLAPPRHRCRSFWRTFCVGDSGGDLPSGVVAWVRHPSPLRSPLRPPRGLPRRSGAPFAVFRRDFASNRLLFGAPACHANALRCGSLSHFSWWLCFIVRIWCVVQFEVLLWKLVLSVTRCRPLKCPIVGADCVLFYNRVIQGRSRDFFSGRPKHNFFSCMQLFFMCVDSRRLKNLF